MNQVGIVPMSAKPYHVGHDMLLRLAAAECDRVVAFVSTSDRIRKGEFPISGAVMRAVWSSHIVRTLPGNVSVRFVSNPVSSTYELLGDANVSDASDTSYRVYSDPDDMNRNFPSRNLLKYTGRLVEGELVSLRVVPREETVNVSGTQMRGWLLHGDKAAFVAHLPATLDADLVWAAVSGR